MIQLLRYVSLFFGLALLIGPLRIEQPLPIHAAAGNPSAGPGMEYQAEPDYLRPSLRALESNPASLPEAFSGFNQVLATSSFVEAENTGLVTYSGTNWSTKSCPYCFGGQYRRSDGANETATLNFNGTSVSVVLVGDARSGVVEIKVDNVSYFSINLFNNAAGNNAAGTSPDPVEFVIATNLSPGPHTVQVVVTGLDGYPYYGVTTRRVGIDGFRYGDFPFGTVRGRVLDPDGDGFPGGSLNLVSSTGTYSVEAGSDGVFSRSGLPAGTYSITASAPNYSTRTLNGVTVTGGSETTGIDIKIPEAAGHPLFGRIYKPHSNIPAIQPAGTTLSINVKTGSSASGWSASLVTDYKTISLPVVSANYNAVTAWTLQATIPAGTPAELYDLTVSSSLGTDSEVRAVQVVAQYGDPFYFVVLGDPQAATNVPGQPTFQQMVDEINLINPAFVLVVGDLIENGSAAEFDAYQAAINRLQVPSYAIAGNHDLADSAGSMGQTQTWGLWKKYFGRRYYSFDYGPYHVTGMDNAMLHIINPDVVDVGGYFADQVAWAQSDLTAHQSSLLRFLFLHIIRQPNKPDPSLITWKPAWIDGLHTNMVHYGHAGDNFVEVSGNTPVHWVETKDMIDGRYRLVRINQGVIGSYTYTGDRGIPSGFLGVSFSPANDGQHNTVTATINNLLNEHFEHALLRFIMPQYGCYKTNKGIINQLVHSDNGQKTVVYLTLDVPTNAQTQVQVSQCPLVKTFLPLIRKS